MPRGKPKAGYRVRRKARAPRRRMGLTYRPRSNYFQTSRFVIKASIGGSDVTPNGAQAFTFTLGDVPGFADFTALFEEFKISRILYRFVLTRSTDFNTTQKGFFPRLMHVTDHTDSAVSGNFAELQQYPRTKENWLNPDRPVTRWFSIKPNTIDVGYTSGVASNYGVNYKRWVSCSDTGTPYYGLKLMYDQHYAGNTIFLECKYLMKFKGPK